MPNWDLEIVRTLILNYLNFFGLRNARKMTFYMLDKAKKNSRSMLQCTDGFMTKKAK